MKVSASIYSTTNGGIAYQIGNKRVLVERNTLGGNTPFDTYQVKRKGVWESTMYRRGIKPLLDAVKNEINSAA